MSAYNFVSQLIDSVQRTTPNVNQIMEDILNYQVECLESGNFNDMLTNEECQLQLIMEIQIQYHVTLEEAKEALNQAITQINRTRLQEN